MKWTSSSSSSLNSVAVVGGDLSGGHDAESKSTFYTDSDIAIDNNNTLTVNNTNNDKMPVQHWSPVDSVSPHHYLQRKQESINGIGEHEMKKKQHHLHRLRLRSNNHNKFENSSLSSFGSSSYTSNRKSPISSDGSITAIPPMVPLLTSIHSKRVITGNNNKIIKILQNNSNNNNNNNINNNNILNKKNDDTSIFLYFTNRIQLLNEELAYERNNSKGQLTKIIKTLLRFESKLKNEQKLIKDQLYAKDKIINKQWTELTTIKRKYNEIENIEIDKTEQLCPSCRKNYYLIDQKDCETQTFDLKSIMRDRSPTESIEFASSSEDQDIHSHGILSKGTSFVDARRSKKYMSKRTTGSYKDYIKHRRYSNRGDDNTSETDADRRSLFDSSSNEQTNDKSDLTISTPSSENTVLYKLEQMNYIEDHNYADNVYSRLNIKATDDIANNESVDTNHNTSFYSSMRMFKDKEEFYDQVKPLNRVQNTQKYHGDYDTVITGTSTFEVGTDDWYASASDMEDSDSGINKPYGHNAVNPVLECVNQILLQQSMDGILDSQNIEDRESPSPKCTSNDQNTLTRPKRVHFSTQNSMVQVPRNISPTLASQQQVQKNLVEENNKKENIAFDKHNNNMPIYDVQSVYGNVYEPIGSANSSSNYYVDMEPKLETENRTQLVHMPERNRIPPALPPKPANLLKLRQISRALKLPTTAMSVAPQTINQPEPDYCSISELSEPLKSSSVLQIVAVEIHKTADGDDNINDIDENDDGLLPPESPILNAAIITVDINSNDKVDNESDNEIFADIPKLPNVAAIIAPKKDALTKFIAQDNYIMKKHNGTSESDNSNSREVTPCKPIPNILLEINSGNNNKIKQTVSPRSIRNINKTLLNSNLCISANQATISTPEIMKSPSHNLKMMEEKMPIQAEFDWYNLDAEYGKLNQPDVIKETDSSSCASSESSCTTIDGVSITRYKMSNKNIDSTNDPDNELIENFCIDEFPQELPSEVILSDEIDNEIAQQTIKLCASQRKNEYNFPVLPLSLYSSEVDIESKETIEPESPTISSPKVQPTAQVRSTISRQRGQYLTTNMVCHSQKQHPNQNLINQLTSYPKSFLHINNTLPQTKPSVPHRTKPIESIIDKSPAAKKRDENYETFLKNSGLSSKPILTQQRKLFYPGPFV